MPSCRNIGNQKPVGRFQLISNVFHYFGLIVFKKICEFFNFNVFVLAIENGQQLASAISLVHFD